MLTLEFDGLFRGAPQELHLGDNAGLMCYGWVILRDGVAIARGHGGYARSEHASSNVAEYLGLIEGLEALLDMHGEDEWVLICGDSKSVIDQMEGTSNVSAESIRPLHRRATRLARRIKKLYWMWTPRGDNHKADALTRRALQQIRADNEKYQAALHRLEVSRAQHTGGKLHPLLDLRMYQSV